jgi:hypothetical protein
MVSGGWENAKNMGSKGCETMMTGGKICYEGAVFCSTEAYTAAKTGFEAGLDCGEKIKVAFDELRAFAEIWGKCAASYRIKVNPHMFFTVTVEGECSGSAGGKAGVSK